MSERKKFSERHGHSDTKASEITIRNEAPEKLRGVVPILARKVGLSPKPMRNIVCQILLERPNSNNWSEFPNIENEVQNLIDDCEWYKVYDIIEAVCDFLIRSGLDTDANKFSTEINKFFVENGIGWQLVNGLVEIRGPEAFEVAISSAKEILSTCGKPTAGAEIHKALTNLSLRPTPDLTGAVQHAMAALECIARDVCGDPKATLGELLKKNPGLLPPPLDQVVEKAWGYASERGRHLREGHEPELKEVELIVGLACIVSTYLSKKLN